MGRPREFDESAVLDRVTETFWSGGYAGTSLADLVAVTGLGKGSLYAAFGDKHSLFLRVFREYCTGLAAVSREILCAPDRSAGESVAEYLRRSPLVAAANLRQDGCLLTKATAELSGQDAEVGEIARKTLQPILGYLEAAIEEAQRLGEISLDQSPRDLAGLVLIISRGIDAIRRAGMTPGELSDIAETAIRVVFA